MNILFLQRLWPVYGGGETVTITLANEMVSRGWNVGVLYFKHNTRDNLPYINPAIKAILVENVDCDQFHQNPKDAKKAISMAKKYIEENNVEFIIDQWWDPQYIRGLKGYHGVKVAKCLHTAFFVPRFDGVGVKATLRRILKPLYLYHKKKKSIRNVTNYLAYVNKYVFLSSSFQKQYQHMNHDDDSAKFDSIPNPAPYNTIISEANLLAKDKTVLVVSRMEEHVKCLSRVIKAWSIIEADSHFNEWKLVFVGEGRNLSDYKRQSKELGLSRISFEGFQDPRPYYEKAQLFLMTSALEGFGMTLVEAQQYGVVPIVMDTFLSLHDIITNNKNGLITSPGNIEEFATAIMKLLADEQLRTKMARQCLVECQRFFANKVVDQWEKMFLELDKQ